MSSQLEGDGQPVTDPAAHQPGGTDDPGDAVGSSVEAAAEPSAAAGTGDKQAGGAGGTSAAGTPGDDQPGGTSAAAAPGDDQAAGASTTAGTSAAGTGADSGESTTAEPSATAGPSSTSGPSTTAEPSTAVGTSAAGASAVASASTPAGAKKKKKGHPGRGATLDRRANPGVGAGGGRARCRGGRPRPAGAPRAPQGGQDPPDRGRGAGGPLRHLAAAQLCGHLGPPGGLDQTGFEKTVVPIGTDPAVTSAVAVAITDQIFTSLNPEQIVENALPPRAAFLAGPITNAAKGYVQDGVTTGAAVQPVPGAVETGRGLRPRPVAVRAQRQQQGGHHHQRSGRAQLGAPLRSRPYRTWRASSPAWLANRSTCRPSAATKFPPRPASGSATALNRPRACHLRADSALSRGQAHPGPPRRAPLQRDHGAAAHSDRRWWPPWPCGCPGAGGAPCCNSVSAVCSAWW